MTKKRIKESLLKQLQLMGATADFYSDLINDYMSFWDIKVALIKDIKKRGVTYTDYSSVGVEMQKNNPSTKELVVVNKQMMSVLKDLGMNEPKLIAAAGDDGSDLL